MCSTPFGINEWITWATGELGADVSVLNAFRHQRMDHLMDLSCRFRLNSAQRLSASTNGSQPGMQIEVRPVDLCSTPFGINEWITPGVEKPNFPVVLCSTPFGINEWITAKLG